MHSLSLFSFVLSLVLCFRVWNVHKNVLIIVTVFALLNTGHFQDFESKDIAWKVPQSRGGTG